MIKLSFSIFILCLLFITGCEKEKKNPGLPMDADGNIYDTVVIGTQTWLTENLKTTKYINGDPIPLVSDNEAWTGITRGAYCWYENNITYKDSFGALYNWYASRFSDFLCPVGYRVPTIEDWTTLADYLLNASDDVNQSFKVLSVGWRVWDGSFQPNNSSWWLSAPQESDIHAWRATQNFSIIAMPKATGYPVRCIKDK